MTAKSEVRQYSACIFSDKWSDIVQCDKQAAKQRYKYLREPIFRSLIIEVFKINNVLATRNIIFLEFLLAETLDSD